MVLFMVPVPVVIFVIVVGVIVVVVVIFVVVMPVSFVVVVVIMPVVVIVVIISVRFKVTLDCRNPGCGSSDLVEVELACAQDPVEVHIAPVALYDFRLRVESRDYRLHPPEFGRSDFRDLVEKHDVAEFDLLDDKILDVLFVDFILAEGFPAVEFALHPESIDDCHDAVELRCVAPGIFRKHGWRSADGLRNRCRLADAAGLYDDVVETVRAAEVIELVDEVHLQGAADAAVLKRDETVVSTADDTSLLDKVGIDVDFADVIDDHGETYSLAVVEYSVEQCSLAASEISRQKKHRYFPILNCDCHSCFRTVLNPCSRSTKIAIFH